MRLLLWTLLLLAPALGGASTAGTPADALDRFLAQPDASFAWQVRTESRYRNAYYAELRLVSQTWKGTEWKHRLHVLVPRKVDAESGQALLLVWGGRWKPHYDDPPGRAQLPKRTDLFAGIAEQLRTPVAVLAQVPFQPLFGGLREDALIAYSFGRYIESGDDSWPLLLPMVRSAIRGMDAVSEYLAERHALDIRHFTLAGASKRGWTTWLTAASDPRVTAMAPMVIDMLNMPAHLQHQVDTWGDLSEQIRDYTDAGLHDILSSQAGGRLRRIIDPYHYLSRIGQPKLLVIGTNDRYWPLDALRLYWDRLQGESHVLYVPNNGHSVKDTLRVVGSLNALHQHATGRHRMPRLEWTYTESADALELAVRSDPAPARVRAWQAHAETLDFRSAEWTASDAVEDDGTWRHRIELPAAGHTALFGEAVYENLPLSYSLSTLVRIAPGGLDSGPGTGR